VMRGCLDRPRGAWRHSSGPVGWTAPPHTAQIACPSTITRAPPLRNGLMPAAPAHGEPLPAAPKPGPYRRAGRGP